MDDFEASYAELARLAPRLPFDVVFLAPGALVTDDRTGNVRPGPGVPVPARVQLEPTTDPRLREVVGADQTVTVLRGRWGERSVPARKPPGIHWGAECPLVMNGVPGTLRLVLAWRDDEPRLTEVYGEPFLATWRTP